MSKQVFLFDVDGTLTKPRNVITNPLLAYLTRVAKCHPLSVVSGSDFDKVAWQLGGREGIAIFTDIFSENGLVRHDGARGQMLKSHSIVEHFSDEQFLQKFINYSLQYMSNLTLPFKRGTFVEFRKGLINLCPCGRSCSQSERDLFADYDKKNLIRQDFVHSLRKEFGEKALKFALGGQISIDAFPVGWDKRFCLDYLTDFDEIHFFGDKTEPGGNDYEIFSDPRTIGHHVKSPDHLADQLQSLTDIQMD